MPQLRRLVEGHKDKFQVCNCDASTIAPDLPQSRGAQDEITLPHGGTLGMAASRRSRWVTLLASSHLLSTRWAEPAPNFGHCTVKVAFQSNVHQGPARSTARSAPHHHSGTDTAAVTTSADAGPIAGALTFLGVIKTRSTPRFLRS